MKRVIVSVAAGGVACLFSWLLGFDFNERGVEAFVTAYLAMAVAGCAYFCPAWADAKGKR